MKILQAANQAASYPQTLIIPVAAPMTDSGLPAAFFTTLTAVLGLPSLTGSDFKADSGEILFFYTPQTRVILLGLGKKTCFCRSAEIFSGTVLQV